jgi:lycopene beta-cyclase
MIRGIDFYNHCLPVIQKHPSITMLQEKAGIFGNNPPMSRDVSVLRMMKKILPEDGRHIADLSSMYYEPFQSTFVDTASGRFTAAYVFNSIYEKPLLQRKHVYLLQHFKGFVIRTSEPAFDPSVGTLMDFRTSQANGTAFVYVLPLSDREALVEYTMFTAQLLAAEAYDVAVHDYIHRVLDIPEYEVVSTEFGVIPMTDYPFPTHDQNIINIGTAGGATKPSTGYTFSFIQRQADDIMHQLHAGQFPVPMPGSRSGKFRLYDSILLKVLAGNKLPGDYIFTQLFRKNRMADVFAFLDNETNLWKDLTIINSLPKKVFARQGLKVLMQNV